MVQLYRHGCSRTVMMVIPCRQLLNIVQMVTYSVKISWDPQDQKEERNTILVISFLDPKTNLEVRHIDYSFKVVYPSTKTIVKDVKNQKAPSGTGIQIVKFPSPGSINISISMTAPNQLHRIENG